jgi:hypothetical protein
LEVRVFSCAQQRNNSQRAVFSLFGYTLAMKPYFNEAEWKKELIHADWYVRLKPEYEKLTALLPSLNDTAIARLKESVYSFFEKALERGEVTLATKGPNLDIERKPIDTVVIHHTGHAAGMTAARLSAIHLTRLYTGFHSKTDRKAGDAIWSNHLRNGKQVFYSYHWFVHQDGSVERLLNDNEIGWHAGDWETNCRSVGICIDDNLREKSPGDVVLAAVAEIIKDAYRDVAPSRIVGHREINLKTDCPGNLFLTEWKDRLLALVV